MSNRYFLVSRAVYNQARAELDAAFGHPNGKAETAMTAAPVVAPDGRVVALVPIAYSEWEVVVNLIASLESAGLLEEISGDDYGALFSEGPEALPAELSPQG